MGKQKHRSLSVGDGSNADPVLRVCLVPCSQNQEPHIGPGFESVDVMAFGLVVAVILTSQHHVCEAQPEEVSLSLSNRVGEKSRAAIFKTRQNTCSAICDVSVTPDDFGILFAAQARFALLGTIQIFQNRIGRGSECQEITFARRDKVLEAEKRLEPSPKNILRK